MDKHELLALIALPLIVAGSWLHWRMAWYRSDAEEDVKDKKITPAQARLRIKLMNWCSPLLTIIGLVLLMIGLFRLGHF